MSDSVFDDGDLSEDFAPTTVIRSRISIITSFNVADLHLARRRQNRSLKQPPNPRLTPSLKLLRKKLQSLSLRQRRHRRPH